MRSGMKDKTAWDWMQLLIVPAILVVATFAWSASQTWSDNKREDRRIAADRAAAEEARQDTRLQAYLDQMSALMLDRKLRTSKSSDEVRSVARTVTLTTLRRLDEARKAEVMNFLYEARLLEIQKPRVYLFDANLEEADLRRINLAHADLAGANLMGADLTWANLTGANLKRATLAYADFTDADLTDAFLGGADLEDANLTGADLARANLTGADLRGATGADLTDAQLKQVRYPP